MTGTAELLNLIAPHVPDTFINDLLPPWCGRGRRTLFSAAQLWRVHLLSVLTPARTFNLLVKLLPEQRAWRRFAHLSNRAAVPDVWMLNQFRERIGVAGLRRINDELLQPLLPRHTPRQSLALIDATDLAAACSGHKKSPRDNTPRPMPRSVVGLSSSARVNFLSATRSTPSDCGCPSINGAFSWYRWSVGSPPPMFPKAFFSSPA